VTDRGPRLRRRLAALFVRVYYGVSVDGVRELRPGPDAPPVPVLVFSAARGPLAQATPFGPIVWNERKTSRLSPRSRRLILLHECSHQRRTPLFRLLLLLVAPLPGLAALTWAWTLLALGPTAGPTPLVGFGAGLALLVTFLALVRVEETLAEYAAVSRMGPESFLAAYREIALTGAWRRLAYPRPETTVRLYRLVTGDRAD
jgi:hypothetical protein